MTETSWEEVISIETLSNVYTMNPMTQCRPWSVRCPQCTFRPYDPFTNIGVYYDPGTVYNMTHITPVPTLECKMGPGTVCTMTPYSDPGLDFTIAPIMCTL
jgi:hypothetical protein